MINKSIFPLADEDEQAGGWTLSVDFLKAIRVAAESHGAEVSLEDVEGVLLAAHAHAILALNTELYSN
jgi:hypothetical protein